jgi:hypothetical protein
MRRDPRFGLVEPDVQKHGQLSERTRWHKNAQVSTLRSRIAMACSVTTKGLAPSASPPWQQKRRPRR